MAQERKPGLEGTFNTAVELYERMRPTYPAELYRDVFRYRPIGEHSRALEVGIGTGQATVPVLDTGATVDAVELGDELAAFCRQKFSDRPNFTVLNLDFQDFKAEPGTYDLIFSATAFHWIPEEFGYKRVLELLKPGGAFARFANRPYGDKGRPQLQAAIQKHYARFMSGSVAPSEFSEAQAAAIANIPAKYGFTDIEYKLYRRTRDFTSDEYLGLLGTYSDHIALEESARREFWQCIKGEIDRFGGVITIYDTVDLELARKPY